MAIRKEERVKNSRLTEFEGTRELVLGNAVPSVAGRKQRRFETNKTLFEFGSA
ncbi:MAG: hypothetical protein AABY13_04380 [Nanoarchaeota archaeon]